MSGISLRQTFGDRIELFALADARSAVYRFGSQPKPCVHPLITPRGHSITAFQMSDHPWHRGLWFTIKLLNGANFWEENAPFGTQQIHDQPVCEILSKKSARLTHRSVWTSEQTATALREQRTLTFTFQTDGITVIDFTTQLIAAQDLLLDRTPFTTWGGYGGLSFRTSRDVHEVNFLQPSGETTTNLAGVPLEWLAMQGKIDGGPDEKISIAILDHPENPRSPAPWYAKCGNGFNFMNAAFLFHEPMKLAKDESLNFRYRVLYRDGIWTTQELAALSREFRS